MWNLENYISENSFISIPVEKMSKAGHGDILSVKIVLPTYCQANCKFCFNNYARNTQQHNWETFFYNLYKSLNNIFEIKNRRISIDITGAEPTFNIPMFERFLGILKYYIIDKPNICKVVLTTNGFQLEKCIDTIPDFEVIDIVNISLHSIDYKTRIDTFKTKYIPSNFDLKRINQKLEMKGITSTGVAVIYDNEFTTQNDFYNFVKTFGNSLNGLGFLNGRIRLDYMDMVSKNIQNMFNTKFEKEITQIQNALKTKIVDDFECNIKIYKGVPDISEMVIGPEMIIDDDGKVYIDYIKEKPITDNQIKLFENNIYIKQYECKET